MAFGKVTYKYQDYDGELSSVSVRVEELNAGNIAGYYVAFDALQAALDALTVGWRWKRTVVASEEVFAGTLPTEVAQRENKWLVKASDNTYGNPLSIEIPTADLTALAGNSNFLDLTAGAGGDLKAALEAIWLNNSENAVTVHSTKFVGRNL